MYTVSHHKCLWEQEALKVATVQPLPPAVFLLLGAEPKKKEAGQAGVASIHCRPWHTPVSYDHSRYLRLRLTQNTTGAELLFP